MYRVNKSEAPAKTTPLVIHSLGCVSAIPMSIRVTLLPAYLSTSESHSGRFLKVVADPMSYTRTMASALR